MPNHQTIDKKKISEAVRLLLEGIGEDIEATPMATFQAVMNTNAWGTLRCTKATLPTMRAQASGTRYARVCARQRAPIRCAAD